MAKTDNITQLIEVSYADGDFEQKRTVTVKQLQNSCRLCLCSEQKVSLFNDQQESTKYLEFAVALADIEINSNDRLPKKICVECASKLILFYKFKKKCELSHVTLTTVLQMNENVTEMNEQYDVVTEEVDLIDNELEESFSNSQKTNEIQQNINKSHFITGELTEVEILKMGKAIEETLEDTEEIIDSKEGNLHELQEITIEEEITVDPDDMTEKDTEMNDSNYVDEFLLEDDDEIGPGEYEFAKNIDQEQMTTTGKKKKQICAECGQQFARKYTLLQHLTTHSGIKNFTCPICNNLFTRKSHVEIHMRIHANVKPYVCELCQRSFTKSGDLARHRRIHTDERNYQCDKCEKRFRRSADVITHMRVHTGERPYACRLCTKSYSSHSSLKKHNLKHESIDEIK